MKLRLKKKYYKNVRRGKEPIRYRVRQPKGKGTDIEGTIFIDPILRKRKNKDLKKALLNHEINEIRNWGKGLKKSHSKARSKEPKLTKNIGGVLGFWKEIEKRERK